MSTHLTVNGVHLVLLGITGNAGDKNGVAKITVPIEVPTLSEVFKVTASDVAKTIGLTGVICTDRPLMQLEHGGYQITFDFEGFQNKATYEQQKDSVTVRFTPEERQEPVQTHPKFLGKTGIAANWKFDFSTDKFAKSITGGTDQANGLSAAEDNLTQATNPMFGTDSWMNFGGTFTRSYAVTEPPGDLWDNIGMLIDRPPDADRIRLKKFRNRKWLKLAPEIESGEKGSGSAIRITEKYRLTGILRGTVNAATILYSQAQLQ